MTAQHLAWRDDQARTRPTAGPLTVEKLREWGLAPTRRQV